MNDSKPTLSSKIKKHFSDNKSTYTHFAAYATGVVAMAVVSELYFRHELKLATNRWDEANARAVAEFGESASAVLDGNGNFMSFVPTPDQK